MRSSAATIRSKYVGETDKNVRNLFAQARAFVRAARRESESAHNRRIALICIDEVENLFRAREGDSLLSIATNQFLQEMDGSGMRSADNCFIVVIGITNKPESLDDAFLRRLPVKIYMSQPTREEMFDVLLTQMDERLRQRLGRDGGVCFAHPAATSLTSNSDTPTSVLKNENHKAKNVQESFNREVARHMKHVQFDVWLRPDRLLPFLSNVSLKEARNKLKEKLLHKYVGIRALQNNSEAVRRRVRGTFIRESLSAGAGAGARPQTDTNASARDEVKQWGRDIVRVWENAVKLGMSPSELSNALSGLRVQSLQRDIQDILLNRTYFQNVQVQDDHGRRSTLAIPAKKSINVASTGAGTVDGVQRQTRVKTKHSSTTLKVNEEDVTILQWINFDNDEAFTRFFSPSLSGASTESASPQMKEFANRFKKGNNARDNLTRENAQQILEALLG